jgi:HEPN domain-containing protein
MDKQKKYTYWLDIANYDLSTADAMLKSGRYVYVAFMCQQSLEKLSKGLYNFYIDDNVPRVHNIGFIINKIIEKLNVKVTDDVYELFETLAAYYLQGRYPSFKETISQTIDKYQAELILNKSKEVFEWLISLKK